MNTNDLTVRALQRDGISCQPIGTTGILAAGIKVWIERASDNLNLYQLRFEPGWYAQHWLNAERGSAEPHLFNRIHQAQARAYHDLKELVPWVELAQKHDFRGELEKLARVACGVEQKLNEVVDQPVEVVACETGVKLIIRYDALEHDEQAILQQLIETTVNRLRSKHSKLSTDFTNFSNPVSWITICATTTAPTNLRTYFGAIALAEMKQLSS